MMKNLFADKTKKEILKCDRGQERDCWQPYMHGEPARTGYVHVIVWIMIGIPMFIVINDTF